MKAVTGAATELAVVLTEEEEREGCCDDDDDDDDDEREVKLPCFLAAEDEWGVFVVPVVLVDTFLCLCWDEEEEEERETED